MDFWIRLDEGISRADMTAFKVVVVAVAVIARKQSTFSLALKNDALSHIYVGRKLCDLEAKAHTVKTEAIQQSLAPKHKEIYKLIKSKYWSQSAVSTHHSDIQ